MADAVTAATSTGTQGALTKEYLARLEAREDLATSFLRMRLRDVQVSLEADLDAVLAKIEQARQAGEPISPSWLYRERRYRTLMRRVLDETAAVSDAAGREVIQTKKAALELGRTYAQKSMQTAGVDTLLADMDPDVMRAIIAGTDYGTPLDVLMSQVADDTLVAARAALVTGVTTGKGIPWIRRRFLQAMDAPRWRAETIARTESQRAFRAATQAGFQENAEHLEGWVWTAALDSRTCPACVVMHGTVHAVTEILDGHPNCRCVMVPRTPDWDDILGPGHGLPDTRPSIQSGKDWLEGQDDDVQRAILGPGKWQAWKDGKITLDDVVTQHRSDAWGTHRREATLAEALGGKKAAPAVAPVAPTTPAAPPVPAIAPGWDRPSWANVTPLPAPEGRETYSELLDRARRSGLYDGWPDLVTAKVPEKVLANLVDEALGRSDDNLLMAAAHTGRDASAVANRVASAKVLAFRYPNGRHAPTVLRSSAPEGMDDAAAAVNPNFHAARKWQVNCTNCTTAYEARRRGVKALARPRPQGGRFTEVTPDAWNADPMEWVNVRTWKAATKDMPLLYPEGARGAVSVKWKGGRSGHIFNWEIVDGEVVWVDAQVGHRLSPAEVAHYGSKAINVRVFRLDDRPLTEVLEGDYFDLEG